jgi:hypothetical protein
MTEIEVTAAESALAALPTTWLSEAFRETILRRASLQASHRKLTALTTAATTTKAAALAAVIADPTDEALAALVTARATESALTEVVIPAPTLDLAACGQAVATASAVLSQCQPVAPLPLSYVDEMARWRNFTRSGNRSDAPVATDADRAAQASHDDADAQVSQWQSWFALWRSLNLATNDVIGLLAGAAAQVTKAAEVADVVKAANAVTAQANAARRAANLNWSATA